MTQLQEVSDLASSEAKEPNVPNSEGFDSAAIFAALDALPKESTAREIRAACVGLIRSEQKRVNENIATRFLASPTRAYGTIRAYSDLTDDVVCTIFKVATDYLHPLPNPTASERISLVAVGGYGRAEMAPFSDVDLLFLSPWKLTPWAESVIESMLYILWDLKLKVGHASRTVKECLRLGREDYTLSLIHI